MKAVIMAGGKGTRIASLTHDEIPKPMLTVGGKPILEHQIECLKRNGIKEIIIVIGHLGNVISDYFGDGTKFDVNLSYIVESEDAPLGTAGSLFYLKEKISDDFILVFGDVFFNVDLERMVNFHKKNKAVATLLTHPNSHPFDSDLIVVNENNVVVAFDSKENNREEYDYHNLVNSGIYVLSPKVFELVNEPKKMAIEGDIISPFCKEGQVFSYHSTEYVKDMGTPERYKSVNDDYEEKIPESRCMKNKQKCIFLDRDGTINKYVGFLTNVDEMQLIDGVAEAIKMINASEYLCIVVTNQPIIARGESTVSNLERIHMRMETLLGKEGAYIDGLYYCPHHPDKGFEGEVVELKIDCECRKPKIGMVVEAASEHNIDLSQSFMIGDSTLDIKLAENAGIRSVLVKTGVSGQDDKYEVKPDYVENDLLSAVKMIIKKGEKNEF